MTKNKMTREERKAEFSRQVEERAAELQRKREKRKRTKLSPEQKRIRKKLIKYHRNLEKNEIGSGWKMKLLTGLVAFSLINLFYSGNKRK